MANWFIAQFLSIAIASRTRLRIASAAFRVGMTRRMDADCSSEDAAMSGEWFEDRRFRFDGPHPRGALSTDHAHPDFGAPQINRLLTSITRTREWLVEHQHPEGFWCGELEGD